CRQKDRPPSCADNSNVVVLRGDSDSTDPQRQRAANICHCRSAIIRTIQMGGSEIERVGTRAVASVWPGDHRRVKKRRVGAIYPVCRPAAAEEAAPDLIAV